MRPTILSTFTGVGGFDLAFSLSGFDVAGMIEIDPQAGAVLNERFPNTPLHADITTFDPMQFGPVTVVAGGFPCQDLSVAGKRAGLEGGRSGLFYEITRIIGGMRAATGGAYPRYAVFENVTGLLSSKKGDDFRAVIEELSERGAQDISWRILDTRHTGIPQRRRRVVIVADFGGETAGEVLDIPDGDSAGRWGPGMKFLSAGRVRPGVGYWTGKLPEVIGAPVTGSLRDILEPVVDEKYMLSPKACQGILNRAAQRGRKLPALLYAALCEGAGLPVTPQPGDLEDDGTVAALTANGVGTCGADDNQAQARHLVAGYRQGGEVWLTGFDCKGSNVQVSGEEAVTLRALETTSHVSGGGHAAVAFALRGREQGAVPEVHGDGGCVSTIRGASGGSSRDFVAVLSATPLQEVGKRTGTSTTDVRCGIGIADEGAEMYTLQAGAQHGVAALVGFHVTQDPISGEDFTPSMGCGSTGGTATLGVMYEAVAPFDGVQITSPQNGSQVRFGDPAPSMACSSRLAVVGVLPAAVNQNGSDVQVSEVAGCLTTGVARQTSGPVMVTHSPVTFAAAHYAARDYTLGAPSDQVGTITATYGSKAGDNRPLVAVEAEQQPRRRFVVRRLTPTECERLQDFPDGWTAVTYRKKVMPDSARYRFMGNALTVRKFRTVAGRIAAVLARELAAEASNVA
ncbi:DNA cytosine methyltransferase [Deinococcus sp. 6YEL10]|uniref:DNA (cytosine-5-)-methyltransferase n=1 Tax=Deinococcus sp. 6YEL10 TaxID=2745870 RepID=UPI001E3669C4|nr:DNA (cytosine-5-)-methyltransferase [Deinococcus sp. 6YEL10]MCD0159687.1 DNA cytosine methyltransferase [Deinococcus sp. 6YEL10]